MAIDPVERAPFRAGACLGLPALAAVISVTVLLQAGCHHSAPRADLALLNGAEPETLDPALITGQPEGRVVNALFEGLTSLNEHAEVRPGVAERWDLSGDGLTYTFHLRQNARWTNGDPVTAHDFARSWHRTLTPETASEYAYQLHYIKNGKPFNEGTIKDFSQVGVRAEGEWTLLVTLENPTPFFVDLTATPPLYPVHLPTIEREGDAWIKPGKIVSNGAFKLDAWRINDCVRLVRNEMYWNRDQVRLRTVEILPTSKANTAFNFYESGLADLMMDKGLAPHALLDRLRHRADFHSAPFLGNYFLRYNVGSKSLADPRVRIALSLVFDRELLVEKVTRGGELPARTLVPPGTAGYQPPEGLGRDVERARKLLAEAGYPGGVGMPRLRYLFNEAELNESIAVELQDMLQRELGVSIELERQEWKVYLRSMSGLDYDVARASWVGDYKDPNTFLDMFVTDGGNNRTGWSNAQYDGLIAEAARELDPQKRYAIFQRAEHLLIVEEAPICPLYFYVGIQLYDATKFGGIEANLLDEHPLKSIYRKTR